MSKKSYIRTIIESYHEALREYDETFIVGEDIEHAVMGTTRGLVDEFGTQRVRDVPVSEQGFHGLTIGAAMDGKRPIIEYQINTMSYVAMDQLVNNAQRLRHMTNGQVSVPITVTVPQAGAPGGNAAQHSDNVYPSLMNCGMKVVVPTGPYDQLGLFRSALSEDDPVAVFWPAAVQTNREEVPDEAYTIPLGEADIKREGTDITVIAVGETIPNVLSVAEDLSGELSVEVVDPRTLLPLDEETILESVRKTGRAVVVDSTNRTCGVAAEISSRITDQAFWTLEAPIKRVTRADVPISYSPPEEQVVLPNEETIAEAVHNVAF